MGAKLNELLTGRYDHTGECLIYGDTDSVYFTATPAMPEDMSLDMDGAIALYDRISDQVSDTFPEFMKEDFNSPLQMGSIIKAGREVVGRSGMFITKKRYAIKCLDIEGYQPEGGKLKIMGMDIKRSDTPEFVQDFLETCLDATLEGKSEKEVIQMIKDFKETFRALEPWKKGMPKRANNVTMYTKKYNRQLKGPGSNATLYKLDALKNESENKMIPGHVRASINWNNLLFANSDNYSLKIMDGAKVVVCRLKNNPMNYTSVAYPTDEMHLPDWFKELPFDEEGMEQAVLDKKIQNVLGVTGWDLNSANDSKTLDTFFEF